MADLQTLGDEVFIVREDGRTKITFKGAPHGYGEGQWYSFEPYEFGMGLKVGGGPTDHLLEVYCGEESTTPPVLSVRNNGNGLGAQIVARNPDDTDGIFLDYRDPDHPYVRWSNDGPYLVKHDGQTLIMRNHDSPTQSQRLWIANRYTPGGVREFLSIGVETPGRFCVRTGGYGGGVQAPLDLDGSQILLQSGGNVRWIVDGDGLFKAVGTSGAYPALKRVGVAIEFRLADDSDYCPVVASTVRTAPVTASSLPSASAAGAGARAFVTDATSATFGDALAGGGSNAMPVWSNGSGWFIG